MDNYEPKEGSKVWFAVKFLREQPGFKGELPAMLEYADIVHRDLKPTLKAAREHGWVDFDDTHAWLLPASGIPVIDEMTASIAQLQRKLIDGQRLSIGQDRVGVIALGHHFSVDINDPGALSDVLMASRVLIERAV